MIKEYSFGTFLLNTFDDKIRNNSIRKIILIPLHVIMQYTRKQTKLSDKIFKGVPKKVLDYKIFILNFSL